jgi:protein arginine kinase activator
LICGECGQKPATIRYTEMVGGELRAWDLCEDCARARGVGTGLSSIAGPLVNILMGLLEDVEASAEGPRETGPACPQCGLTYGEFRSSGRLGCGACYESFADELKPLLRRVHGSTEHVGRFPSELSDELVSKRELRKLKAELESAIRREDYERAAVLRDRIHAKEADRGGADAAGGESAGSVGDAGSGAGGDDVDV